MFHQGNPKEDLFNTVEISDANKSMKEMVINLINQACVITDKVLTTMLQIDRADFIQKDSAYIDESYETDYGTTFSAPHIHASILEYLKDYLLPGNRALSVESGSAYL